MADAMEIVAVVAVLVAVFFIGFVIRRFGRRWDDIYRKKIGPMTLTGKALAERQKVLAEFANGNGLAPAYEGANTERSMLFEGNRNGRKVAIGIYTEYGRERTWKKTPERPRLFAYAFCAPRGLEMTVDGSCRQTNGNPVKSGDAQFDYDFLSRANDPMRGKGILGIDALAKIKEMMQREKALNGLRYTTRMFVGGGPPGPDSIIKGEHFPQPLGNLPAGQGFAYMEKNLPEYCVGVDNWLLSLMLEFAVMTAEKAERL